MIILKAIIDNYRSFKHEEVLFGRRNLVVGENNAGKTNLLQALNLVLDPYVVQQRGLVSELDFYGREFLNEDGSPVDIRVELVIGDLSDDDEDYFRSRAGGWECWDSREKALIERADTTACFDDQSNVKVFRVAFGAKYDDAEGEFTWETFYPKLREDENLNVTFTRSDKKRFGLFYLRSYRNVDQALALGSYSVLSKLLKERHIKFSEQETDMIRDAQQIGNRLRNNVHFEDLLQDIVKELNRLVPLDAKSTEQLKFEFLTLSRLGILRSLVPSLHVEGAEKPYPAAYQGSGTRNALVFSTVVKLAEKASNCIFLFEEPESSLHPHLQRSITRRVQSLSKQCFVSTHSPFIAESFESDEILLLRRELFSTKVISPKWNEKGMKFIERYFKSQVMHVLFSKAIVLVEGPTDEGFFSEFSRYLDERGFTCLRGFDSLGCAVISCESKPQMATFAGHLQALGLPLVAVVDDESTTTKATGDITETCDLTISFPEDANLEKALLFQSDFAQLSSFITCLYEISPKGKNVAKEIYDSFQHFDILRDSRDLSGILESIRKFYSTNRAECCETMYRVLTDTSKLGLKSTRYGRFWANQYCKKGVRQPKSIVKIFVLINKFLAGSLEDRDGTPTNYVQLDT